MYILNIQNTVDDNIKNQYARSCVNKPTQKRTMVRKNSHMEEDHVIYLYYFYQKHSASLCNVICLLLVQEIHTISLAVSMNQILHPLYIKPDYFTIISN